MPPKCLKVTPNKKDGNYDVEGMDCDASSSDQNLLLQSIINAIKKRKPEFDFDNVKKYINLFKSDIDYFLKLDIKGKSHDFKTAMLELYYSGWGKQEKEDMFKTYDENNQISVLLSVYKVIQNNREFTYDKITAAYNLANENYGNNVTDESITSNRDLLSDIHDGWALARLITAKENDDSFNKTNYKTKEVNIFNKYVISLDTSDQIEKNFLLAILNKNDTNLDKLLKQIHISIELDDIKTTIRADQLAMMLPFDDLLNDYKKADMPFLKNYINEETKTKTFDLVNGLFPNIKDISKGGRKLVKKSPIYKKTDKRVNIKGKDRIVYTGLRGAEYIKNNGEFIKLKKK